MKEGNIIGEGINKEKGPFLFLFLFVFCFFIPINPQSGLAQQLIRKQENVVFGIFSLSTAFKFPLLPDAGLLPSLCDIQVKSAFFNQSLIPHTSPSLSL